MKIFVAGHKGLVGSAIVRRIEQSGKHTWVGRTREELDLFDSRAVKSFVQEASPDAVIMAAAKVGGIVANLNSPVEFLSENLKIQTNLLEAAHEHEIERLLFLGSSCIYPKFAPQPLLESYLLTGSLEPTNEPYAIAKIAGVRLTQAYASQYGRDWISLLPTNIYGPGDNFDPESSHVLPALIHKIHDAKVNNAPTLELWGSGKPKREFLFSEDLADACIFLLENYHSPEPINVGVGEDLSIEELAEKIKEMIGYKGTFSWNTNKPDGTPKKLLDVSKALSLGWKAPTLLESGLEHTYRYYLESLENVNNK